VSIWSPVTAMLWESWRLTWRQLVFFGALACFGGWAMLAGGAVHGAGRGGAYVVLMMLLAVATMAQASMSLMAGRATLGFPDPLAFGRPVRTSLFVAVPMFYRAAACAAIYAVPAAALRAMYGVPFPVTPIAVLLAGFAVLFLGTAWFTRDAKVRTPMTIALLVFGVPAALRWLNPWNASAGAFPPRVASDMVQLAAADYAVIALAVVGVYLATVRGVQRQRHGDGREHSGPRPSQPVVARQPRAATRGFVEHFRDAALAIVRWPCPTSSPLAAELWIETKARALPVLAIGSLLALCVPLLVELGANVQANAIALLGVFVVTCAIIVPALPFFAAISTSFWNREASLRAPMNAFEATRPIATARLAAVQIVVALGAIFGAWTLIAASLWFSLPLADADTVFATFREAIAASLRAVPIARLVGFAIMGLVTLATVVALLAAIRAFAAVYGKRLWLGALGLGLYAIFFLFAILTERWSEAAVGLHLWAVAAAIPAGTAFAMVRALTERIVLPRHAAVALAVWGAFIAVVWLVARDLGISLDGLAPALGALVLALALLPLTASILAAWSFGLIRHA
jgi:hypothetical protein